MRTIHENRKTAGVAVVVLAAMAIVALVSPASASSGKPPDDCLLPAQELIAVISPEMQARIIIEKKELQAAVEARFAEAVELDITWVEEVRVDGIRKLAVLDRYVDMVEPAEWKHEWHPFAKGDEKPSKASHPLTAAIDVLVSGAKMPARAALAAQHLIEAFAKVTPRVVRALA